MAIFPETLQRFATRSRLISRIRQHLEGQGFLETQTPILQSQYGGANAEPFATFSHSQGENTFLRIAPELYLIMMLAGGMSQIYEIGPVFRNEGQDRTHNPEFTMLELYQVGTPDLIAITQQIVETATGPTEFHVMTMQEAVWQATGITFTGDRLIQAFERYTEPNLIAPTFITHFPIESSPLAQPCQDSPQFAERFELFANGMEIANGYFSETDPQAIAERNPGIDSRYIAAMETGMPSLGGLGIGIDRLMMMATGVADIREEIAFPHG
jgi:lysyl-tRNA synthetase class 2